MKEKENTVPTSRKKKILYSVIVAVCALLLVAAIVLTVYFVAGSGNQVLDVPPVDEEPGGTVPGGTEPGGEEPGGTVPGGTEPGGEEPGDPTGGEGKVAFVSPVEAACSVEYYKIYENKTLDKWYYHKAVDYSAPEGTEVRAMADGEVTKISLSEKLGNLITVKHENGITSTYRFVEPVATLKEGDKVTQGQLIAHVASAYGTEAKDGTHLHLEMTLNDKSVDPNDYIDLTLEEK